MSMSFKLHPLVTGIALFCGRKFERIVDITMHVVQQKHFLKLDASELRDYVSSRY